MRIMIKEQNALQDPKRMPISEKMSTRGVRPWAN